MGYEKVNSAVEGKSLKQQEIERDYNKAHKLTGLDFEELIGLPEEEFEGAMDQHKLYAKHIPCGEIFPYIIGGITKRWIVKYGQEHSASCPANKK